MIVRVLAVLTIAWIAYWLFRDWGIRLWRRAVGSPKRQAAAAIYLLLLAAFFAACLIAATIGDVQFFFLREFAW